MTSHSLSKDQLRVAKSTLDGATFLEGPAGTGKTTAAVARLSHMYESGIEVDAIVIVVPQRTLAGSYYHILRSSSMAVGGQATILTIGGLSRRMVGLFWPLISEKAGFKNPEKPPTFLTMETAQYYMAQLVQPLLTERGFFESVSITRNRLYSQILDNLNKAAVVGFPYTEIGTRLKTAWMGDPAQAHIYDQAQSCAALFREKCLENNLLDFSLQMEVFYEHLWPSTFFQEYFADRFRHLIVDNLEEDTPVAHDLLREWLTMLDSALLIYDTLGGYRRFLGADPKHAYTLKESCDEQITFAETYVTKKPT